MEMMKPNLRDQEAQVLAWGAAAQASDSQRVPLCPTALSPFPVAELVQWRTTAGEILGNTVAAADRSREQKETCLFSLYL